VLADVAAAFVDVRLVDVCPELGPFAPHADSTVSTASEAVTARVNCETKRFGCIIRISQTHRTRAPDRLRR
jgi:hypothetical protein